MPVALISTSTSPAFGPSRSSSTISSGFFASKATAARVFIIWSRFVFYLSPACIIGARPQIDVEVVHVAGDVRIIAEGRHHVLLRRVDVLAAACHRGQEIA